MSRIEVGPSGAYRIYDSGKRYKLREGLCGQCGKAFLTGHSIVSGKGKFCSRVCSARWHSTGDRNVFWNGGKRMTSQGYIHIWNPGHHRSMKNGYVPEHVLIAESKIGRRLFDNEVVHHINGIKDDNRAENLEVMTEQEHKSLHGKQVKNAIKGHKGFQPEGWAFVAD